MSEADEERYVDDARRYRLDERIATGGMGQVWRGTDTVLGRTVAIKVLKEEYADDATFRSRFASEARHAGALHHPGIATVFDAGEAPVPFLVMEHVEGKPLSELLRAGQPLDPDVAADLMAQAADALAVAHARGIVHRDVKPANLLVTPEGRVKVTDFGIARAAEGVALTETGQVMGTPQYLSPEQARGEQATAASDQYSLGVVAFEALAGRRPFAGDTPVTTALAHLRDPVPDLPGDVPAGLAAVVRRALAKDPEDRHASAADFAAALRDPSDAAPAGATAPVAAAATTQRIDHDDALPATSVLPVGVPPAAGVAPAAAARTAAVRRRGGLGSWWPAVVAAVAGVVLIAVVAAMTAGGDTEDPATPGTSTSASDASTAPTSSAPATTSAAPSPTRTTPTTKAPKPTKPPKDKGGGGKGKGKGKGKKK